MDSEKAFNRSDPFVIYIAAEKLLKPPASDNDREQINRELIARVQTGNKPALNELVVRNYRLARTIMFCMAKPESNLDDLAQGGMVGLIKAAQKFDLKLNFTFSTYAVWWIRAGIRNEIISNRLIHLSHSSSNMFGHLLEFQIGFSRQFERSPTRVELATELARHEHQLQNKKSATDEQIRQRLPRCLAVVDILFDSKSQESLDESDNHGLGDSPSCKRENPHRRDDEKLNSLDYCLAREELKSHQILLDKIMKMSADWSPIQRLVLEKRILALPEEQLTLEAIAEQGINKDGLAYCYSRQRINQLEIKITEKLIKHFHISKEKLLDLKQIIDQLTKLVNS